MKMSDSKTYEGKEGDSYEITVVKLEPVPAYQLVAKLGKLLVPAVVALQGVKATADVRELVPAADKLFDSLTPEMAMSLMKDLFATVTIVRTRADGVAEKSDLCHGQAMVNRAFRGDLKAMLVALKFAFEVNFGDFFDGSGLVGLAAQTPSR
jgi:hypothetical protein